MLQKDFLYEAILQGNYVIVQMLVLHGAWILMRDKKSLLFTALENGDIYMVDFLVKRVY